jgi:hypothetical protein
MTSPTRSGRIAYFLVVGTLAVLSTNGLAEKANQTRTPGKQFMVARYTSTPPVIDGVFSPAEWQGAVPVHVNGNTPATAPGVVPSIGLPNLLAPGDAHMALVCGPNNPNCPNPVVNNEGFKLTTSVCNQSLTDPSNNPNIVWESKAGRHPHGFVVEFRIPLDSINSIDTSWFSNFFPGFGLRRPQAGDTIGFNAAVGDDDNGGLSYVRSEFAAHTDSFTAWDGRSVGWYVFAERDWGNLYMAPPTH